MPSEVLGDASVVPSDSSHCHPGEGMEAAHVEWCVQGREKGVHRADERGDDRPRDIRSQLSPADAVASEAMAVSFPLSAFRGRR